MSGAVRSLGAGVALLILLVCGFLYFPGHTFLQSDTQIYLPILDRLSDPTLYRHDPVAYRPHVSYTIYDEAALALRAVTGLGFEQVLAGQQLAFRFCGLVGAFLIGLACGIGAPWAVLFASVYGLGATIVGPSVLIAEYEPVPRGFAVPLLMLAMGLAAHQRWKGAGLAAGAAILYHPPTTVPVLVVCALAIGRSREAAGGRRWRALLPVAGAVALVYLFSKLQRGATEPQQFLATIDPALEQLQRLRGSYNFISIWFERWVWHWVFVFALAAAAWWRLRAAAAAPSFVVNLAAGFLAYGLVMAPLSYLLLERVKWSMMPQFQPLRALLWVTLFAMLGAALNGIRAAQDRRVLAAALWFAAAYTLTGQLDPVKLPMLAVGDPVMRTRLIVFLGLGALSALAVRWSSLPVLAAALLLPFFAIPQLGKVRNYPALDHPEIHALAEWAQKNTGKDTVFQFPDAGPALYPGLFRVFAQRTVYADWKGGGQVNLLKDFADDWWKRWRLAGEPKVDPAGFWNERAAGLAEAGIDYVVLQPAHRLPERPPSYSNSKYVVYKLR